MQQPACHSVSRVAAVAVLLIVSTSSCGGSYEETISGVAIPVPKAMSRGSDKPVEMNFFGVGAGQASFHSDMDAEKIVEFYKKEMPARGWQPNMSLRSGSTLLAYSKDGKTMLVAVGKQNNATQLTVTVGGAGR
jgi:hypothetical protein